MKMKATKTLLIFTAVLVFSGGITAYAASTLFTQTIPGQTFYLTPYLTPGCRLGITNFELWNGADLIRRFCGPLLLVPDYGQ